MSIRHSHEALNNGRAKKRKRSNAQLVVAEEVRIKAEVERVRKKHMRKKMANVKCIMRKR